MTSAAAFTPDRSTAGRWRPRVTRTPDIDVWGAQQAAADLLIALGLDLSDENLI